MGFVSYRRWDRVLLILAAYGLLAGVATLWGHAQGHDGLWWHSATLAEDRNGFYILSNGLLGLALGLVLVLLTRLLQDRSSHIRALHNEFHHLLSSLQTHEIVVLVLASAVGEELFFRGAVLSRLQECLPGVWGSFLAVLGSSAAFALIHIAPGKRFFSWTMSSVVVGLAFALMYVWMGDLTGPVVAHIVVNGLNLRDIIRRPRVV